MEKEDCDEFPEGSDDSAELLSATEAITLIECTRGAYQSYFLAFRSSPSNPKNAVQIILPARPGEPAESLIGNAEYYVGKGMLNSFGKGRGLFDCGDTANWVFDGKNFLLANASFLGRCGGVETGNFPMLWRSDVK